MKTFFEKAFWVVTTLLFAFSLSLTCFAKNEVDATDLSTEISCEKQEKKERFKAEYRFTPARAVAAGGAIVLFVGAQIIIYKKTARSDDDAEK